jgi:hypothetical protein
MKVEIRQIALLALLCLQTSIAVSVDSPDLGLSEEERQWLNENPTVSFTGDPNWLPYEAFDANGEYIGIVSEANTSASSRSISN